MKILKRRQLKTQQEKPKKRRRTGVLVAAAAAFTVLAATYFLSPSTHKIESLRQDAHQEQNQKKTPEEQRSETRFRPSSELTKLKAKSLKLLINTGLNYNPLLSEFKDEYPYQSLDCRFVPENKAQASEEFVPDNEVSHDEAVEGDFYDVGHETFIRRLDELESLAKEKNIRALVSIIDFLNSLNIETADGYLDQVLILTSLEASKASDRRMLPDAECWIKVREARTYLDCARGFLIEIVASDPSSMATVLSQLPEKQRTYFLLDIARDLYSNLTDGAPNLDSFETMYLSLPERERKQVEEALFDLLFFWMEDDAKKLTSLSKVAIANLDTPTRKLLEALLYQVEIGKHH